MIFIRMNHYKDYFDVISYVGEADEQRDSSKVWLAGYIELA